MTVAEMKPMAQVAGGFFEMILGATDASVSATAIQVSSSDLDLASLIWDTVAPLGMAICIFYFLIEINKIMLMEGNNMTMKSLGNPLLKLGCGFAFIQYGDSIMTDILNYGNALTKWALDDMDVGTTNVDSAFLESVNDMVNDLAFWNLIIMILAGFLMWIVSLIVGLIVDFKLMILKYEILFRIAFSPIALGDIFEGKQSHAVRYIKKILACFTYAVGMVFVLHIGAELVLNGLVADYLTVSGDKWTANLAETGMDVWGIIKILGALLLVPITEIGAFGLIKQASNDVWGC